MAEAQVPAAHRVLQILTLLSSLDAPVSAARIRAELDLPRSTTYHLLAELESSGYVVHLPDTQTYGLGMAAYSMAQAYTIQQPIVRLAEKDLRAIAEACSGTGHLSRLAGSEVVYLREIRSPQAPSLITQVGVRLSALRTASGRAMVAHLPEAEARSVFTASGEGSRYQRELSHLAAIRERGWEEEREEVSRGQRSIAVPVLNHLDRPAAALAVTFATSREPAIDVVAQLQAAASRIRTKMFTR